MRVSVKPITESDTRIKTALESAHIPALMNALVHITGNVELIRGPTRPTSMILGDPQGGIAEEDKTAVREIALKALIKLRDSPHEFSKLTSSTIQEMTEFITGSTLSDEYTEYALNELALDENESLAPFAENVVRDFHVVVVGAGMSGLLAAIRLQQANIPYTVIEKNSDVGGTWFENRYPGCRVDSPNHVYSYSFAQQDWPQHFSDQPTLLEYFQRVADENNLRDNIRFDTHVVEMRFSQSQNKWLVTTKDANGTAIVEANAVITAVGQLNRPKMPELDGVTDFQGPSFHSAEWNFDIPLKGKRVGIIGTGASAFQFTPEVVKEAAQVEVFLRTPPWVMQNPAYHEYISDDIHWLLNHVPFYAKWFRFSMFWTTGEGLLSMARCEDHWEGNHTVSAANEKLRKLLTQGIENTLEGRADLIEKLVPKYPPAAKRMLIDNGHWYRALRQEHVNVVDAEIDSIVTDGIRTTDGCFHECDVIIFGTGFKASQFLFPMKIYGVDGKELRETWQDEPRAYLGVAIPNYPNLFSMYGPNTNIVVNGSIIFFSECEMHYIMTAIAHLLDEGYSSMECNQAVFEEYNNKIDAANLNMAWGASSVNSWYKNSNGRITQNWPGTLVEFWQQSRKFAPSDYTFR